MKDKLLSPVEPRVDVTAIDRGAPSSRSWRAIALLAPTVCIAIYLLAALGFKGRLERTDLAFCLLVFVVSFPWSGRFKGSPWQAVYGIGSAWLVALSGLALLAHQTHSLNEFHSSAMAVLTVAAPLLQCWPLGAVLRPRFERNTALRGSRKAVMVGAGAGALIVARALQARPVNPMELVGWFDDRGVDRLHAETSAKLLGPLSGLAAYVREHRIDEVYITLPMSSHPRIASLLESVHGTTASVYYVPDIPGIGIIQGRLHHINGVLVLGLCETPFVGLNEVVKRVSDVVLSSLILTITSPLLLAISIGIKLGSPGPVLFKQRRNGLDGHEITVYKFRTMTVQEDGPEVVQATRNDPRITRFGAFLRRTSLDELPQFFNVLGGSMSIVGPRPHAVAHNEHYRQAIKAYMVRHKVRPGITGWAQVNGMRGETESVDRMRARVEYDLAYLRNWSLWLDLRIVAITIRLVFFDRNAY